MEARRRARPAPLEKRSAWRGARHDLVALDDALTVLAPGSAQGPGGRDAFLRGLSVADTAEALEVSVETVARDWRLAKLLLLRELQAPSDLQA